MSQLVLEDTGRWDINTLISPALAAALEAAPALPEGDAVDPGLARLHDALQKLERGESERRGWGVRAYCCCAREVGWLLCKGGASEAEARRE